MKKSKNNPIPPRMSDEAVYSKTGRKWKDWFGLLDKDGCKQMSHKEIVKILKDKYEIGSWWQQMITVSYEQSHGLRKLHQRPDGYSIGVSRTLDAPVSKLYQAWMNDEIRKKWLKEQIEIRTSTNNKSIRILWNDKKSKIDVDFYPKSKTKTQLMVQHNKIQDEKMSQKMKSFWSDKLTQLKSIVE